MSFVIAEIYIISLACVFSEFPYKNIELLKKCFHKNQTQINQNLNRD